MCLLNLLTRTFENIKVEEEKAKMPIVEENLPNEAPNPSMKGKPCFSRLAGRIGLAGDYTWIWSICSEYPV